MILTFEEQGIIKACLKKNRRGTIEAIQKELGRTGESFVDALFSNAVQTLESMSDDEFSNLDLSQALMSGSDSPEPGSGYRIDEEGIVHAE